MCKMRGRARTVDRLPETRHRNAASSGNDSASSAARTTAVGLAGSEGRGVEVAPVSLATASAPMAGLPGALSVEVLASPFSSAFSRRASAAAAASHAKYAFAFLRLGCGGKPCSALCCQGTHHKQQA